MEVHTIGPFTVVKEGFTSRWKVENSRCIEDASITIRNVSSKDKEIRIEAKGSSLKDILMFTDAKCDDYSEEKAQFSCILQSYRIRLTFQGTLDVIIKLHKKLFEDSARIPEKKKIIIPKPNIFRHCPVRSEVLACTDDLSPDFQRKRTSFSKPAFLVRPTINILPQQQQQQQSHGKIIRAFRSGLTPPEKKANLRRSPLQPPAAAAGPSPSNRPPPPPHNDDYSDTDENKPPRNQLKTGTQHSYSEDMGSENVRKNLASLLEEVEDITTINNNSDTTSREQAEIIAAVQRHENVFFTGGAGTGKSTLLKQLVDITKTMYGEEHVFVTATTGLAACAVQGSTLHQLFGIPAVSEESEEALWEQWIAKTVEKRNIAQRLRSAKVIIVDEISMLGPKLFEFMDKCLRRIHGQPELPMGGVQIICCGDFFQLPPVQSFTTYTTSNKNNNNSNNNHGIRRFMTEPPSFTQSQAIHSNYNASNTNTNSNSNSNNNNNSNNKVRYVFQSRIWPLVFPLATHSYVLSVIYRQQMDAHFAQMLEEIRVGRCSPETLQRLNEDCHAKTLPTLYGIQATQILTHKKDVDCINAQKLAELSGEKMTYVAQDSGDVSYVTMLQKHCPAKTSVELKIGAQVVLVKTTQPSEGLVNGARGVVVRFHRDTRWPVVKFAQGREYPITLETFPLIMSGRVLAQRTQLPLDLAWAISVHRAQGMTVDQGEVDVKHAFEFGQIYVALSRVRSRAGLSLRHPILPNQIKVDACVQDFYHSLQQAQQARKQQQLLLSNTGKNSGSNNSGSSNNSSSSSNKGNTTNSNNRHPYSSVCTKKKTTNNAIIAYKNCNNSRTTADATARSTAVIDISI